jgi:hypothetical protein
LEPAVRREFGSALDPRQVVPEEQVGRDLPLGVMQRFQGRYAIASASQRGLVGTVGHLDLRLLNGEVSVYAIQS